MMTESAENYYEFGEDSRQNFEYEKARNFYLQAKEVLEEIEDSKQEKLLTLLGQVLNVLGLMEGYLGYYEEAASNLEEAFDFYQSLGEYPLEKAKVFNNLGMIAERQKHPEKARSHYQDAINWLEQAGDHKDVLLAKAVILNNLSLTKTALGEYRQDRLVPDLLQEALDIFQTLHDQEGVGQTLHNMAYTEYVVLESIQDTLTEEQYQARFDVIQNHYTQALEVRQETGDKLGEARTLNSLGCLYGEYVLRMGRDQDHRLERATESLEMAQKLFEELPDEVGQKLVAESFKTVNRARRLLIVGSAFEEIIDVIEDIG